VLWAVANVRVEPKGNAIMITKQASGTAKIAPNGGVHCDCAYVDEPVVVAARPLHYLATTNVPS